MNTSKHYPLNNSNETLICTPAHATKSSLSYNLVSMSSGVLLFLDIISILVGASLSSLIYASWLTPFSLKPDFRIACEQAALIAAVLVPFILYDARFGTVASGGQMASLIRSYALRFTLFASVLLALGIACQALERFPVSWLVTWFAASVLLTSGTRLLVAHCLRRLQHQGVLTEVIAVVGAGPVADRLVAD